MAKYIIKIINQKYPDGYNYCIKDWMSAFGKTEFFTSDAVFNTVQDVEEHIQKLINSIWHKDSTFEIIEVKQYPSLPFGNFYYTDKGYEEFKQYEGLFNKNERHVFSHVSCKANNNIRGAWDGIVRGIPRSMSELREDESCKAFLDKCPDGTVVSVEINVYGYGTGKERAINEREFSYLQICYGRDEDVLLNCEECGSQKFMTNMIHDGDKF